MGPRKTGFGFCNNHWIFLKTVFSDIKSDFCRSQNCFLPIANQFLPIPKPVLRTVIIGFTIGKKTLFDSGENRFWHRKKTVLILDKNWIRDREKRFGILKIHWVSVVSADHCRNNFSLNFAPNLIGILLPMFLKHRK